MKNGEVSFWFAHEGARPTRSSLDGGQTADVCIVGAGLTGLWTAYYLKKADPSLRIIILEARFAGFGASGRNGGWLTNAIAGSHDRYAKTHGVAAARMLQKLYSESVDEVIDVCREEDIVADIVKGGNLVLAYNQAQLARVKPAVETAAYWGLDDWQILNAREADDRINAAGSLGGYWNPQCARINPAKLVMGLAKRVEEMGVTLFENSKVIDIEPGCVRTESGQVNSEYVVRATEGFTAALPGQRRSWLPMNSSMIVTDRIPEDIWSEIGWAHFDTLGDMAHAYTYAQRTADGRIAIGGRGVPYRFGSQTDVDGATSAWTVRKLREQLCTYFPQISDIPIAHAWSGVLGVPRDWCATVTLDPDTRIAWAGGYVGHGVTTTNLAGRTLRDLILGQGSVLTQMPWVGRKVRSWEPEPVRWLGVRAMYLAYRAADAAEGRSGSRTSVIARVADKVSGRH
jgi:glycine/D-amino acid oxidase-like deaminating enzyme